jgi:hypothetical protein
MDPGFVSAVARVSFVYVGGLSLRGIEPRFAGR